MSVPLSAAIAAGALILGVPVLVAATTVVTGTRAASAADSAALAAADAVAGFLDGPETDPCRIAETIASLHRSTIVACETNEETLDVRVTVTATAGPMAVTRKARAGPPNTVTNRPSHTEG